MSSMKEEIVSVLNGEVGAAVVGSIECRNGGKVVWCCCVVE